MRTKNITMIIMTAIICSVLWATTISADTAYDYGITKATLLNQEPDPAEQGDYVEVRFKIEKPGSELLENVEYFLDVQYPFSFDASDKALKKIGSWSGQSDEDEFYTLYYKLKVDQNALEGNYKVNLKTKNSLTGGNWISKEYELRVGKKTEVAFVLGALITKPTSLTADTDEAEFQVAIENIGNENAQNVMTELQLPDGFSSSYSYSDTANLGTIEADGSSTATYYIDVDKYVAVGMHRANLTIKYKEADDDNNVYLTKIIPLDISVKGKPQFEIVGTSFNLDKITAGSQVFLKLNVKNTGQKEADSVSIRAFKESSQPFEFDEKSDFIGNLKPQDEGEAVLKFNVEKEATPKTYILDLEIRSIYNDQVIVEEEKVQIKVENGEKKTLPDNFTGIMIILLVVIGLAMAGGYWAGKKKRLKSS
ncbi:MAG: hypothetical protein DRN66_03145 [Candidatus Nanohalarchaeota archaeon]|nr:MAG: hypothetical protein DRN66_03145 [Candidatus Nanohaloarchaeota archaeon]